MYNYALNKQGEQSIHHMKELGVVQPIIVSYDVAHYSDKLIALKAYTKLDIGSSSCCCPSSPIIVWITANYHNSMVPLAEVKSIEKDLERVIDEPGTPYELHLERFR